MSSKKMKLDNYLPEKPKDLVNFQAKVRKDLFEKVKVKKRNLRLNWEELQEALFQRFLDEQK